ncbi:WD40-repeat-containing domain protein [Catenaria anguillulae PL171]|uniref:WD40-repeat-containing domain protein n=1 Tax=Catenaria anguillulae PL171 TaxID=765915 RepID=A0A1Y2HBA6_9FUNG|nr:WD40-repeat-containing domain protein [Catenaria anguillulae PL171]
MYQTPSASNLAPMAAATAPVDDSEFRLTVNQDCDCLCLAKGVRLAVFATLPNGSPRRKTCVSQSAPISSTAMLHKTNLLAFIAGAKRKRVKVYDDLKQRTIFDIDSAYPIARILLRRDSVIVLSTHALTVYALSPTNPSKLYELALTNITLVAASTSRAPRFIVATETQQRGHIQILDLTPTLSGQLPLGQPLPSHHVVLIKAHDSSVRALALSPTGALAATASDRGTLIRVWDTATGAMTRELRRGADPAQIHSLVFSADGSRLVVVSDKATVHVFHIGAPDTPISSASGGGNAGSSSTSSSSPATIPHATSSSTNSRRASAEYHQSGFVGSPPSTNTRSHLSFLTPLLPSYFNSEWSSSSCKIPLSDDPSRPPPVIPHLVAWLIGDSDKVMVASSDGRLWRFALDRRTAGVGGTGAGRKGPGGGAGSEGVLDGVWRVRWPEEQVGGMADELPVVEDL